MIKKECESSSAKSTTYCEGNKKYEGYCIDLLNFLSMRADFTYEVVLIFHFNLQEDPPKYQNWI